MDWNAIWAFVWPILRQALIAFLVAILALLGYDGVVVKARFKAMYLAMRGKEK